MHDHSCDCGCNNDPGNTLPGEGGCGDENCGCDHHEPDRAIKNFADRLLTAVEAKGAPVCVGLDPVYEQLPEEYQSPNATPDEQLDGICAFCEEIIDLVAPHVPAVKPQVAYFERYGAAGLATYFQCVYSASLAGLTVIGDVKRGDIGSTAAAYARGHLENLTCDQEIFTWAPDAITVNGYFGLDGTGPFIEACREQGGGLFVLVRTSNPGGAAVQDFQGPDGLRFFEHMAALVAEMGQGEGLVGEKGYSSVGAVVGATYPDEARQLRELMPRQIFLVPGYGAQGATAADCAAAFDAQGRGAIVNASRSVLYAFKKNTSVPWRTAVEDAAKAFAEDIASAVGR